MKGVLAVALLGRVILFPLTPALSDDGYRYLWDGLVQAEGVNPYRYTPSDPALFSLRDEGAYATLNSPHYHSVYPPVSQILFWGAVVAGKGDHSLSWYLLKGLLLLAEVGGIYLLGRMVSPGALALYAWHPLPMLEGAGQGHTEAALVGALLLCIWALQEERRGLAGVALAIAGWVKLVPFMMVAVLWRALGKRGILLFALAASALAAPYAAPYVLPNVRGSLALYVGYFEWYAAPYLSIKALGYALTGRGWEYALGVGLQAVFAVGVVVMAWANRQGRWPPAMLALAVYGLFLTLTTTVHPWYLLGVLALLPFVWERGGALRIWAYAWLWLSAGAIVTYLYYTHGDPSYTAALYVGWTGWAVLGLVAGGAATLPVLIKRRAEAKWKRVREYIPAGAAILDLGAGEGYVGALAAAEGHEVTLADVLDLNRTPLPMVRLEGERLPFPDGRFDAVLLLYVLHHAGDAEELLSEARRVSQGRVLVLESLVESPWDELWLPWADRWANRLRSWGAMGEQERRTAFRTAGGWARACREAGFDRVEVMRFGGPLHRQALIVANESVIAYSATTPSRPRAGHDSRRGPASGRPPSGETT